MENLGRGLGLWEYIVQIPLVSSHHVSTRHDTFDVSSASRRACRAVLVDKLDIAKIHGLDTMNVSCRVET